MAIMDNSQIKLDEEKIPKLLLSFAIPAMVGMIAGAIYNIVDRIFVGRFVGANGLAAITICFPTMLLMFALSLLISVGGSSRVAILRGAKKHRPAEQVLAHAFMMLTLVGCVGVFLALSGGIDYLLKLSGASDDVIPQARNYLRIILIGGPFALVGIGMNSLVRACGSPRYAMATQVTGALTNVVLDAFFIAHLGMGVEGAAWGTILAQFVSTCMGIGYFFSKLTPLRIRLHFILRPRLKVVKRIMAVGMAPFFVELSFVLYMTIMNRTIHQYGGDIGLSAVGIFFSIDSLLFLPSLAIGEAAQPIIGYNYGAGKPERVVVAIKFAIIGVTCFYICSFLLAEIFAPQLVMLFNRDPELLSIAVPGMRIGYCAIVFIGLPIITNAALQGLGKARASLAISFVRHVFFMFIPILILPRYFGIWGVWMSFPTGDFFGFILGLFFLRWLLKWLRSPQALIVE